MKDFVTTFLLLGVSVANVIFLCYLTKKFLLPVFLPRYEQTEMIQGYMRSQYGVFLLKDRYEKSESFYQRMLVESTPYLTPETTVLDVGCALGRMSFEYEKFGVKSCLAVDSSHRFIRLCKKIQRGEARIGYSAAPESRVRFDRKSVFDIREDRPFSFISCLNVVDRVASPLSLAVKLRGLLCPQGVLLLTTPYDWDESPTPLERRVSDMKEIFSVADWSIEKEAWGIEYTMPKEGNTDITYSCHMLILRRK